MTEARGKNIPFFGFLLVILLALLAPSWSAAQDEDRPAQPTPTTEAAPPADEGAQELDPVIVTGTRMQGRSAMGSTSPIDTFSSAQVERQGSVDLTDALRNIAPSFNTQRFPIADGTSFIRPANLRNLSPDQTLVLINGHRRHRSALVNLQVEPLGTVNQGAQAVDFSLIPAAAIDRVEVLRDGASAQYGSDAIAGVINILLKDNPKGLRLSSQYGQMYAGDGAMRQVSANWGLPMVGGFFNLTADYISSDPTSRGSPRVDAAQVAAAVGDDLVPFNGLGQRWGDPDVEGQRLFFNMAFDSTDLVQVYGHGNYVDQDYLSSFFYRTPVGVTGVSPRPTLMVDANGDGDPDTVSADILAAIDADPRFERADLLTFDSVEGEWEALNPIHTRFPGGYTPLFGAAIRDVETVFGLRSGNTEGLRWDLSGRYGENRVTYVMKNSINPSLGSLSPLEFRPGTLEQREAGARLDFVYGLPMAALSTPLNTAFGLEYRTEVYEIGIGDPASWQSSPTGVLFGVGSDGFQGDPPEAAGTWHHRIYAGYVDVEADVTPILSLGAAARLEDSNAFDSSFTWKLAGRLQAMDWMAWRATVSTGFRAPTPGQINTLDITTTADATGALVPHGTFPVSSPAARALGATPLEPEESLNYTAGVVFTPIENYTLTLDLYRIEIEERIALATFTITDPSPERDALIAAGVPNANLIGSVAYFTNAFDTTVTGVEAAAIYRTALADRGYITLDLRHSENRQEVDRFDPRAVGPERLYDLENQLPRRRSIFTVNYQSPWRVDALVRVNRYGSWEDKSFGEHSRFDSAWLVDFVTTVQVGDALKVAVGAENVFDNLPDAEQNSTLRFLGATRPITSPFGFNGGFWFLRASAEFF